MYPITIINDPADITDRETHHLEPGQTLADWILRHYGPDGFPVPTQVYVGGISEASRIDLSDFEAVNVRPDAPVFILHTPLGTADLLIYAAIALVVAVAVIVLMPLPSLDSAGRRARKSPNNALSGQSNIARLLDRVPEVFGQVRSYPDLIAPTVTEFIDHVKFQREYMCIGRGYYDTADFKSGDTLLSDIPGSSATLFAPGTVPAEILKTRQSNEVAGQELIAPNDVAYTSLLQNYTVTRDSGANEGALTAPAADDAWDGFENGDTVELVNVNVFSGGTSHNLDGTYTIASAPTATVLVLDDVTAVNANWLNLPNGVPLDIQPFAGDADQAQTGINQTANGVTAGGTFPVIGGNVTIPAQAAVGWTGLLPANLWPVINSQLNEAHITKPDSPAVRGPFVVPGTDRNAQVWLDITAPRGLAKGKRLNKTLSIDLSFLFEEIDAGGVPTGPSFVFPINVAESTRDPRFWTFKVTSADGLSVNTRYRVTGQRLTESQPASSDRPRLEEIRWGRLAGIQDITAPDTSGTTRVITETRASEQVAAIQDRKFNVEATRKTVTWNGSAVVGDIETGVGLTASRRMADALLQYTLDPALAALSLSSLDVQAVFDIQDALDAVFSGKKGEFSYTFDNADVPALEEMRQIGQAARCFLFREGSVFSLIRDEAQTVSRGLFNRRNKLPDSERRNVRFNRPLDNDGVKLEYRDIDDNNTRTITLPDDLPVTDPHAGLPNAVNPVNIEATGIRQWEQAWDRAQYEFRKQIYSRVSIESTVTADALLLPLNARIQHVDGTRLAQTDSDGEVKAVNGLIVTTSERCIFGAGSHSVVLRDEEGNPDAAIGATARTDTDFGFILDAAPSFTVRTRDAIGQRGTLYSFGPDGNELAESYLVQRKAPTDDNNVTLELINYSVAYYSADDETPPPRPEV